MSNPLIGSPDHQPAATCPTCGTRMRAEPLEVDFGAPYRQHIPGPLACPNAGDPPHAGWIVQDVSAS